MKLSLTLCDSRAVANAHQYWPNAKREDYERVYVESIDGDASVIAGLLRSIADDIDPDGAQS